MSKRAATTRRLELIAVVEYPPRNQDDEKSNNDWGSQLKGGTAFRSLQKWKSSQVLTDSEDDEDSRLMPPPAKSMLNCLAS